MKYMIIITILLTPTFIFSQSKASVALFEAGLNIHHVYEDGNQVKDPILFDYCENLYLRSIRLDSNNVKAIYHLGVLYQNEAVRIMNIISDTNASLSDEEWDELSSRALMLNDKAKVLLGNPVLKDR